MRLLTTLALILLAFSSWSQANTKFIEVSVKEEVQLKVVSAKMSLSVYTVEAQMAEIYDSEYSLGEDLEYLENLEHSEESPYPQEETEPKMSAAERKQFEKEEKERAAFELERQERYEQQMSEFVPYTLQDLIRTLRTNNIEFEIKEMAMSENYNEWAEMMESGTTSDSLLIVTLLNDAAEKHLLELISDKPIDSEIIEIVYDKIDSYILDLGPKMAERAKKQADGLALSVGKKVGAILTVSNVYPGFSPALMQAQFDRAMQQFAISQNENSATFSATQASYFEMVYRFALID